MDLFGASINCSAIDALIHAPFLGWVSHIKRGESRDTQKNQIPQSHHSSLDLLSESVEDGLLEGLGLGGAGPAALDRSVASDEELFKVPLDALEAQETGLLLLEPGPERVGAVAVDLGLLHDGEGDAVVDLAEALDLLVGPGLLGAELVAGEAEDDEIVRVLLLDVGPELLQAGVLRGEAALGGRVDDEDDLALVIGQGDLLAALCGDVSIV
jgi:hypothetical protein